MTANTILQTMRSPFLLLVVSCLSLPLCYSIAADIRWSPVILTLIVASALLAHISVNMLNEYMDCDSDRQRGSSRTPFSGGSGALVAQPQRRDVVKHMALVMVGLTITGGLAIVMLQPAQTGLLVLLGLLGAGIVVTYTPWLNRLPWLCLLAPGTGFGLVMCFGSYVALTGRTDSAMLLLALIPMLLVNNLLLLNQFPDADIDRRHGRRHLVIVYGYRTAATVLCVQWCLAAAIIAGLVVRGTLPVPALATLTFLLPALWIAGKARHYHAPTPAFIRAMGLNVLITLLLPVALAVSVL
ncbi:prenyltransferase [Alteromonas halophila]|uniref:Prenyltransferase n=1 Tax=Alteromonas halophila TaxID=516698 RepID=A0A918JPG6_9ALTE|nr:prenyltransferase [Alteromonas halophila]GGW91274.1 hypothetical protein GCM10007391_27000 [Alteromonas halophila]